MALGTGQLSLGDIAGEYGGSAPHALSEYYSKGNAPGSGEIQIHADFQGTSNIFSFNISSGANTNFRTLALAAGWDGSALPYGTLTSGQTISSGSTGSYAFVINGSLPSGSKFINNGTIVGRGGNGGSSSGNDRNCITGGGSTGSGTSAGPGLQISTAIIIHNSGRVAGGGGGGGAGGRGANTYGAGGGGGGGIGGSSGGSSNHAGNGGGGSTTSAGGGGGGYGLGGWSCPGGLSTGSGGSGGSYGASGGTGGTAGGGGNGTAGGSGGAATSGNSNVTWSANGTINGSQG